MLAGNRKKKQEVAGKIGHDYSELPPSREQPAPRAQGTGPANFHIISGQPLDGGHGGRGSGVNDGFYGPPPLQPQQYGVPGNVPFNTGSPMGGGLPGRLPSMGSPYRSGSGLGLGNMVGGMAGVGGLAGPPHARFAPMMSPSPAGVPSLEPIPFVPSALSGIQPAHYFGGGGSPNFAGGTQLPPPMPWPAPIQPPLQHAPQPLVYDAAAPPYHSNPGSSAGGGPPEPQRSGNNGGGSGGGGYSPLPPSTSDDRMSDKARNRLKAIQLQQEIASQIEEKRRRKEEEKRREREEELALERKAHYDRQMLAQRESECIAREQREMEEKMAGRGRGRGGGGDGPVGGDMAGKKKLQEELKQQIEDNKRRKAEEQRRRAEDDAKFDNMVNVWGMQEGPLTLGKGISDIARNDAEAVNGIGRGLGGGPEVAGGGTSPSQGLQILPPPPYPPFNHHQLPQSSAIGGGAGIMREDPDGWPRLHPTPPMGGPAGSQETNEIRNELRHVVAEQHRLNMMLEEKLLRPPLQHGNWMGHAGSLIGLGGMDLTGALASMGAIQASQAPPPLAGGLYGGNPVAGSGLLPASLGPTLSMGGVPSLSGGDARSAALLAGGLPRKEEAPVAGYPPGGDIPGSTSPAAAAETGPTKLDSPSCDLSLGPPVFISPVPPLALSSLAARAPFSTPGALPAVGTAGGSTVAHEASSAVSSTTNGAGGGAARVPLRHPTEPHNQSNAAAHLEPILRGLQAQVRNGSLPSLQTNSLSQLQGEARQQQIQPGHPSQFTEPTVLPYLAVDRIAGLGGAPATSPPREVSGEAPQPDSGRIRLGSAQRWRPERKPPTDDGVTHVPGGSPQSIIRLNSGSGNVSGTDLAPIRLGSANRRQRQLNALSSVGDSADLSRGDGSGRISLSLGRSDAQRPRSRG